MAKRLDWLANGEIYAFASGKWRQTVYPALLKHLATDRDSLILDYGSGHGPFSSILANQGYKRLHLFDPCRQLLDLAVLDQGQTYEICSSRRQDFGDICFDYVVFSAVWMTLAADQCADALAWMKDHLREDGRILFSVTHPCFRASPTQGYRTNFSGSDYVRSGERFEVYLEREDGEPDDTIIVEDYHYSLTDMFEQIAAAGLRLTDFEEVYTNDTASGVSPSPSWICGTLS